MATKLTAQLDAVSTCHRHRITPHTAAMLHPLTAAVPFTMLRLSYANLPCHNPHRATHPYQVSTLYTEPRRTQRDAAFGGGCCTRSSVSYPHHPSLPAEVWSRRGSRPRLCVHMDLNSDTSSDEEEDAVVAHAAVSLSTTRQPSANKRRAASRPNAEAWLRRSCRPQRSSEIYEAEPATQPRIQEVGVVLGSHDGRASAARRRRGGGEAAVARLEAALRKAEAAVLAQEGMEVGLLVKDCFDGPVEAVLQRMAGPGRAGGRCEGPRHRGIA